MLAACFICSANPFPCLRSHSLASLHLLVASVWYLHNRRFGTITDVISDGYRKCQPYLSMGAHQHLLLNTCGCMAGCKTRFYRTWPHPLLVSTLAWASCQSKLANPPSNSSH
ncbi:hypothetical protein M404DRAFT_900941 [Pisolithus tinctorius Marx 270]|uniref:Uncharacterized protein n=1 Tax=Pisolithus tinctorius Marx 270 TaxID=870435 RepID=A0A0C3PN62_PISTI|nr:hypothetical protein M404DRAFT_900941 [Pisolithus tinctorius Marx 270]